ncbi:MAG: hypothetical protein ACKO2V_18015 [Snowella sp.]
MLQNLDIKQKTDPTNPAKAYIFQILDKLVTDYQQTRSERIQIALWEEEKNFSLLGIIEMLTDEIRGYSLQSISSYNLENSQEILSDLQKIKLFEIPYVADWYFSLEFDFPRIKNYLETLNYLRLLVIEYLLDNITKICFSKE